MSLALLTRGYIRDAAPAIEVGPGPDIVRAQLLKPDIDHGREIDTEESEGED